MSVEVVTLGCRLNISESETLRGMLAGNDRLTVINSCAVTSEAVRQTRQAIRRAKKARPDARLLVTGCAAEIERDMLMGMDEVDGLIANAAKLDPRAWALDPTQPPRETGPALHTRAFVQVQNGCDHDCTFCVIYKARGPSRSRAVADVLDEVARHCGLGGAEVVLSGVDLGAWGEDLPGKPRLGDLVLAILDTFPRLPRLRLSSLDGIEIDPLLFELIAGEERVMPHLHLSLQSGDDLVLKRMKRRHTRRDAIVLVEALRKHRPDLAIGADLIAGFPTESEAAHANSLAIVEELGIVHGHVFPFSPRPGTPAARMPQVEGATIRRRAAELREAVSALRARWLESQLGQPLRVLAERDGCGHAPNFAPVRLPEGVMAGDLVSVTPTRIEQGLLV